MNPVESYGSEKSSANTPDSSRDIALGFLDGRNFEKLRVCCANFDAWRDHSDFQTERESHVVAYEMAGATVCVVDVEANAFMQWARHANREPKREALDEFAQLLLTVRRHPQIEIFCSALHQREALQSRIEITKKKIRLPASAKLYAEWAAALTSLGPFLPTTPTADVYVSLLVRSWAEAA